MGKKRSFKLPDGRTADIDEDKVQALLEIEPDAKEVASFIVGKDTVDVPVENADKYLQIEPTAKPLFEDEEVKKKGSASSGSGVPTDGERNPYAPNTEIDFSSLRKEGLAEKLGVKISNEKTALGLPAQKIVEEPFVAGMKPKAHVEESVVHKLMPNAAALAEKERKASVLVNHFKKEPTPKGYKPDDVGMETYAEASKAHMAYQNADIAKFIQPELQRLQQQYTVLRESDAKYQQSMAPIKQQIDAYSQELTAKAQKVVMDNHITDPAKLQEMNGELNKAVNEYAKKLEDASPELKERNDFYNDAINTDLDVFVKNNYKPKTKYFGNGEPIEPFISAIKSESFSILGQNEKKAIIASMWDKLNARMQQNDIPQKTIDEAKQEFMWYAMDAATHNENGGISQFALREMATKMKPILEEQAKNLHELRGKYYEHTLTPEELKWYTEHGDSEEKVRNSLSNVNAVLSTPDGDINKWQAFGKGFASEAGLPFIKSLNEISTGLDTYRISQKILKKQPLTPEEATYMKTVGMADAIRAEMPKNAAYNVGAGLAGSMVFLGEFAALNPVGAIVEEGSANALRLGLKGAGNKIKQAAYKEAIATQLAQAPIKFTKPLLYEALVVKPLSTLIGATAQTLASPNQVINNTIKRMTPQALVMFSPEVNDLVTELNTQKFNIEGYRTGHNEPMSEALPRGFAQAFTEIFTEKMFTGLSGVSDLATKGLMTRLVKDIPTAQKMFVSYMMSKYKLRVDQVDDFLKNSGLPVGGFIEEFGEEVGSGLLQPWLTGDGRPLGDWYDPEKGFNLRTIGETAGVIAGQNLLFRGLGAAATMGKGGYIDLRVTDGQTVFNAPISQKGFDFIGSSLKGKDKEYIKAWAATHITSFSEKEQLAVKALINHLAKEKIFQTHKGKIVPDIYGVDQQAPPPPPPPGQTPPPPPTPEQQAAEDFDTKERNRGKTGYTIQHQDGTIETPNDAELLEWLAVPANLRALEQGQSTLNADNPSDEVSAVLVEFAKHGSAIATPDGAITAEKHNGKYVKYKGELGIIHVDEGGKITVETPDKIYDIQGNVTDDLTEHGIEPINARPAGSATQAPPSPAAPAGPAAEAVSDEAITTDAERLRGTAAGEALAAEFANEQDPYNAVSRAYHEALGIPIGKRSKLQHKLISAVEDAFTEKDKAPDPPSDKIDTNEAIVNFAERIKAGEEMTSPEDLQFYENNAKEIESLLSKEQTPTALSSVESKAKALEGKKLSLDEKAKKLGYIGIKQFNAQNQLNENLTDEEKALLQEYSDFQQEIKNLKDENVIAKLSDDEFSTWSKANDITRDDLGKVVKDEEIELAAKRIRILNARGDSKKAESELKKLKESKKKDNWTKESWKERFDEDIEQSEIDEINSSNKEFNKSVDKAVESLLSKEQTPTALRDVESTAKALENKIEVTRTKDGFVGDFLNDYELIGEGSEHTVYRSKDGSHVIRISEPYNDKSESTLNVRVRDAMLISEIIGDGSLEVIGYYESENGTKNPIYKQNFQEGTAISEQEAISYLQSIGAIEYGDKYNRGYLINYEGKWYKISDLTDNFFRNKNGEINAIDAAIQEISQKVISEAYHKAKADGSNPELVKAVESLLFKEQTPTEDIEAKKADIERRRQEDLDRPYNKKKQELSDITEIASYGETYGDALNNLIKKQEELNNALNKRQKEDTKDREVKQYTKEELEAQPEWKEIKRLDRLINSINDVYGSAYGFDAKTSDGVKEVEQELKELPNKRKTADSKINAKYDEELKAVESLLFKEQNNDDNAGGSNIEAGNPGLQAEDGMAQQGEEVKGNEKAEEKPPSVEEVGTDAVGNYNPKFKKATKVKGEATTIEMPNGETREAEYMVVESDDILASHNEISFNDTEGFPKTKDGRNANSRNYKGDKSAQLKVNDDAANLKSSIVISDAATPDTGVPIISEDGIVLSGNGRTMAIKLSQNIAPEKYEAYKADLVKRAAKFGIDPNEVAKMKKPILVKVDKSVKDYSVKTFDEYNGKSQKEESPIDKAIKRSAIIQNDENLKERILSVIGRHETMTDLFENKSDRKELFDLLVANNIILKQETPKYVQQSGEFTNDGKDLINDVLIATILSPETLEATNNVKAFRNKIINALPALSVNYKLGNNSLEAEVNDAIMLQSRIAAMGSQDDFWKHLRQMGMFDAVNPNTVIINRMINNGAKDFKKFVVSYNKSMEIDENNLFGGDVVLTKQQVIDNLKESNLSENEKQIIANLEELYDANEQKGPIGNGEVVGGNEEQDDKGDKPPVPPREKRKIERKIRDEKLKKDIDDALDDMFNSPPKMTMNGIDPDKLAKGIKVIGLYVKAGVYKFSDIIEDAYAKYGEAIRELFDAMKAAYLGYLNVHATDAEADKMDTSLRGVTIESIIKTDNNDNNGAGGGAADSPNPKDGEQNDDEIILGNGNEGGGNGNVDKEVGQKPQGGQGIGGIRPPIGGAQGNNKVDKPNGAGINEGNDAGSVDGRGNDIVGRGRLGAANANGKGPSSAGGESNSEKLAKQKSVDNATVKVGDIDNIKETLPFLLPEQQHDVKKAEDRFFGESHKTKEQAFGKGMLFTNGTGTGKTYTGLGIIKRFVNSGKGKVLIVVPSSMKAADWRDDGKNLGLDIHVLADTKDAGKAVSVTTYANFRANEAIYGNDYDLVVYDESHRLMEDKGGKASSTTYTHYEISNKSEDDAFSRLTKYHPLWVERNNLQGKIRDLNKQANNLDLMDVQYRALRDKIDNYEKELVGVQDKIEAAIPALKERAKKAYENTKVVFLSATPFKFHFNLRYANGFLFDWGNNTEVNNRGSRVDAESRFYLEKFGSAYEWKYHQLQVKPLANPDAIAMQEVAFADNLMKDGAMSGRAIDSPQDYSREFPVVSGFRSEEFNKAFGEIFSYENRQFDTLAAAARKVFFNYNYTTQLFEALKTSAALPRIQQHLDLGRKVVIFHRRHQANTTPPFKTILDRTRNDANATLADANIGPKHKELALKALNQADEFEAKYIDLLAYEQTLNYDSAVDQITRAFPGQVKIINGNVTGKDKNTAVKDFNTDGGNTNILVIQEEAGKEGISLHDITGKNPRVLMSLSMPISTTTALQIEGRIFRIGQQSNAIFEYPLLGLDLEIAYFGNNLNKRLSTTENLALGTNSRDLIRSYSEGVLNNSTTEAPHEGQGVGGKEYDKKTQEQLTPFGKAKLIYATNQKTIGTRNQRQGVDFYPTPEPLGQKMVEWADMRNGEHALEPSAGMGAIAMWVPNTNSITAIEPSFDLYSKLTARAGGSTQRVINGNFEDHATQNKYETVVMNPPFGHAGSMAMQHVKKAFSHLREGGRIVAIVPVGNMDKLLASWLNETDENGNLVNGNAKFVATIQLPASTFSQAGTSVNTRVVIIDKVRGGNNNIQSDDVLDGRADLSELADRNIDLRSAKNVGELFDSIENLSMPARTVPDVAHQAPIKNNEEAPKPNEDDVVSGVTEFKHTVTGAILYKVTTLRSMGDAWKAVNQSAVSHKGKYSPFAKGWLFTNKADAEAFVAKQNGSPAMGAGGINQNIHAQDYTSKRMEAKTAYEKALEQELEVLIKAYAEARGNDAALKKLTETTPKTAKGFIKRLLQGATPESVAESKAALVESQRMYAKEKAEMRAGIPRERGANFIIEKISRAARNGDISQEAADLAIDLVRISPEMFQDLAISITQKNSGNEGSQGWYRSADALVKIFKNPSDPTTAVHELLHHAERFMPYDVRVKIIEEWQKEVALQIAHFKGLLKSESDATKRGYYSKAIMYLGLAQERSIERNYQNAEDMKSIMLKYLSDHADSQGNIHQGLGQSFYQLFDASEWWAVNASRLMQEAKNKPELKTWIDKAKAFLNKLIAAAKKVFKGSATQAVEDGLKAIYEGKMLSNREGQQLSYAYGKMNNYDTKREKSDPTRDYGTEYIQWEKDQLPIYAKKMQAMVDDYIRKYQFLSYDELDHLATAFSDIRKYKYEDVPQSLIDAAHAILVQTGYYKYSNADVQKNYKEQATRLINETRKQEGLITPAQQMADEGKVVNRSDAETTSDKEIDAAKDVESTAKALESVVPKNESFAFAISTLPIEGTINYKDIKQNDFALPFERYVNSPEKIDKEIRSAYRIYEFLKEGGKLPNNVILLDKEGKILDGNNRVKAQLALGITDFKYAVANNTIFTQTNYKTISEAYHKAKADGSNPELVKAVEDALAPTPSTEAQQMADAKAELARAWKASGYAFNKNAGQNMGFMYDPAVDIKRQDDLFKALFKVAKLAIQQAANKLLAINASDFIASIRGYGKLYADITDAHLTDVFNEAKKAFDAKEKDQSLVDPQMSQRTPNSAALAHDLVERVKTIYAKFGVPIAEQKLKKVRGFFQTHPEIVKISSMFNVAVGAHELMHYIIKKNGMVAKVLSGSTVVSNQLKDIYINHYPGAKDTHAEELQIEEGMTMLVNLWVQNPAYAQQMYGDAYYAMFDPAGSLYNNDVHDMALDFAEIIEDFLGLPANERIGARIRWGQPGVKKRTLHHNAYNAIKYQIYDKLYLAKDVDRMLGNEFKGSGIAPNIAMMRTAKTRMQHWFVRSKLANTRPQTPGKDGNWKEARYNTTVSDYMDLFHDKESGLTIEEFNQMLVARRQLSDYKRIDKIDADIAAAKKMIETLEIDNKALEAQIAVETDKAILQSLKVQLSANLQNIDNHIANISELIEEANKISDILERNRMSRPFAEEVIALLGQKYAEPARLFDEVQANIVDMMEATGMVSAERANEWRGKDGYASFRRYFDNEEKLRESLVDAVGSKGVKQLTSLFPYKGSDLPLLPATYSQALAINEVMMKGSRNMMWQAWAMAAANNKDVARMFRQRTSSETDKTDNIVVWMDGEKHIYQASAEVILFANAIENIQPDKFEEVGKAIAKMLQVSVTGIYLPFALVNLSVDAATRFQLSETGAIPVVHDFRTIYHMLESPVKKLVGQMLGKEFDPNIIDQYISMGGKASLNINLINISAEGVMKQFLAPSALDKAKLAADMSVEALSLAVNLTELMGRATEYRRAIAQGKPTNVAMMMAQNSAIDWNQRGNFGNTKGGHSMVTKLLNTIAYGFSQVVAFNQIVAGVKRHPVKSTALFTLITAVIAATQYLIYGWGDDDEKREMANQPVEMLPKFIYLPNSILFGPESSGLTKIRVPELMGYMGSHFALGARSAYLAGLKGANTKPKDIAYFSWKTEEQLVAGTLPPTMYPNFLVTKVGQDGRTKYPRMGAFISSLIPTAAKTEVEVINGMKEYPTEMPIIPNYMSAWEAKNQYDKYTTASAKALASVFGWSPKMVDYYITQKTGRGVKMIIEVGEYALGKKDELDLYNPTQVNDRFFFSGELSNSFYDKANIAIKDYNSKKSSLTLTEEDVPLAELYKAGMAALSQTAKATMTKTNKQIDALQLYLDKMEGSPKLTQEERDRLKKGELTQAQKAAVFNVWAASYNDDIPALEKAIEALDALNNADPLFAKKYELQYYINASPEAIEKQ